MPTTDPADTRTPEEIAFDEFWAELYEEFQEEERAKQAAKKENPQ